MADKTESFEDKLRSILAQFEFSKTIREYDLKGIHFRAYMYVPERHPDTNEVFYEREDDAHLLKVSKKYISCVKCINHRELLVIPEVVVPTS